MRPNNELAVLQLKSLVGSFIFDDPIFPVRINIDDPSPVLIPHFDQNLQKDIKGKAGSILASPGGENWRNSLILICGYYFSFYSILITVLTYNEEF